MRNGGLSYSLIIPHYNDAARLERLLKSVPIDRADIEVLVVDDCSPDQSELSSLAARWPKVRWLSTRKNAGAGAARNVGLEHAQKELLVFADSDDEFLPGAFELFDQHVGPDDELVYFLAEAVQEVDGSSSNRASCGNELCRAYLNNPSDATLEQLKGEHLVPWAKVYSRAAIKKLGTTIEETRVSNDVSFNVLASVQLQRVRVVPLSVYRVYRRGSSLTSDPNPDAFLERVHVQGRLASRLRVLGVKYRPPATGWMLTSLSYGPVIAFKTWVICFRSDLEIDVTRMLRPSRWFRFLRKRWRDSVEKAASRNL
jgi:glycosyltransferase involved in cell wall biosynthesis